MKIYEKCLKQLSIETFKEEEKKPQIEENEEFLEKKPPHLAVEQLFSLLVYVYNFSLFNEISVGMELLLLLLLLLLFDKNE